MPELLSEYTNGNYHVSLLSDGTKTRTWEEKPEPVFPESIDLKITDWCDAGCAYCHESSTVHGQHADTQYLLELFDGLSAGMEIAIGGGHPLAHPDIELLLTRLKELGCIANLTVNKEHWFHREVKQLLLKLVNAKLVHGIGLSTNYHIAPLDSFENDEYEVLYSRVIMHGILGITSPQQFIYPTTAKWLLLGFKQFGFGLQTDLAEIELQLHNWNYWFNNILANCPNLSFDNLALEQLNAKSRLPPEVWQQRYMGDDGEFTMYIDAVTKRFAKSSTSERRKIGKLSVNEMFQGVRRSLL